MLRKNPRRNCTSDCTSCEEEASSGVQDGALNSLSLMEMCSKLFREHVCFISNVKMMPIYSNNELSPDFYASLVSSISGTFFRGVSYFFILDHDHSLTLHSAELSLKLDSF